MTIENSLVTSAPYDQAGHTLSMLGVIVNATVDRSLARTWGCAQGTEAAVVMPGGGSPFYVVFD